MLLRPVLLGNPKHPDSWGIFQRALLVNGLYYMRDGLNVAADHLLGPGWHLWGYHDSDGHIPPGYAILSQDRELIVVIKGTTNSNQWVPHVMGSWAQQFPMPSGEVYVHLGFHWPVRDVIWLTLREALDNPPAGGWEKVYVVGHSYGGGCAAVLKTYICDHGFGDILEVTTFGAPRAWAGELNESRLKGVHIRVEGPDDTVTHLPPPMGSARTIISSAASWALGAGGAGAVARFVGGQVIKQPFSIPYFRHYGDRVDLQYNGILVYKPGEQAPNGGPTIPIRAPAAGHTMDLFYVPSMIAGFERSRPVPAEIQALIDKMSDIQGLPAAPDPSITLIQFIGRQLSGTDVTTMYPGYLTMTPADLASTDSYYFTIALGPSTSTIGAHLGSHTMAWKFTAFISWGEYGRSVSIHNSGPTDIQNARTAALEWVKMYAPMLGYSQVRPTQINGLLYGAPGAPCIEWIRVSDPTNPRNSQRFRVIGEQGVGYNIAQTGFEADMPWVGVSLSIAAKNGNFTVRDTVSILGQPDQVASRGSYNTQARVTPLIPFSSALGDYLKFILPGKNATSFGTMGRNQVANPNRDVTGFETGADGSTWITCPTGAFPEGSYIRLIGTRVPYYNREWKVYVTPTGQFGLFGSRPDQAPMPNDGKAYLTRDPLGIKQLIFYPYSDLYGSFNIVDRVFISKRNPAARYTPFRSSRKRRTPAK